MTRQQFWIAVMQLVVHRGFAVTNLTMRSSHSVEFHFHCPCGQIEHEFLIVDRGCTARRAASQICTDFRRHIALSLAPRRVALRVRTT